MLHDREPEPRPLARPGEAIVDPVELLEDAPVLAARDAAAVVAHLEHRLPGGRGVGAELHLRRRASVLLRVREQVQEEIDDRVAVDEDRRGVRLAHDLEGDAPSDGHRPKVPGSLFDDWLQLLPAKVVDLPPRLHPPPVEEAVDPRAEALGFGDEALDALVARLLVGGALDRLGEEADRRQRCAKLVADLGDEIRLQLAQVRLAPHEDEHEHDPGSDRRHERHRQDAEDEVVPLAHEHEDDPDAEDHHRRDDDEVDEELDDPPVADPLSILRRDAERVRTAEGEVEAGGEAGRVSELIAENRASRRYGVPGTPSQSSNASAPCRASIPRPLAERMPRWPSEAARRKGVCGGE